MATNIRGTDGNVALPAFSGNDLDTGVYFPSAGNVAIATNGVNAVTINETQNATFANAVSSTSITATSANVTGSLGVGTAPSGTTGEIRATNNVTAYYSSDRKFKENIQPIPGALSKVVAIGGKTFDWTDAYIAEHGGADGYFIQKSDFGVIAQDVMQVFPQAVRTRQDGSLAVDYEKLSALAFAAIAELKAEIDSLKGA